MYFKSLIDSIGYTPLVRLCGSAKVGAQLLAKMELANPFGMKDRVALNTILKAKESGELKEGDIIIESSSGTLASGLAIVGRALGHEVHIVTDPRIDSLTLAKLHNLGVIVHIVEHMDANGWQGARLEKLRQLIEIHPSAFWPRQYSNVDNPLSYKELARELLEDIDQINVLVGAVGSGGSLCGTAHALKERNSSLTVIGVDAVGSAIFNQPDNPHRLQSGLGNSLVPPNVDKNIINQVHWLNDSEAFAATLRLAYDEQIFAGNSSGSAYWVARWVASQLSPEATVVVILPDRGDRYYNTIYNPIYREEHHLMPNKLPLHPRKVIYGTITNSWSYAELKES